MDAEIRARISELGLRPGMCVGLIGAGKLGEEIGALAERLGCTAVYYDPPREAAELEDLSEDFSQLWGNGMGGCPLSGAERLTYLPIRSLLARCDVVTIQVPLSRGGAYPTAGMLTPALLSACRPGVRVVNFSSPAVFSVS